MKIYIIDDNQSYGNIIASNCGFNIIPINKAKDRKEIYLKIASDIQEEDLLFINCEVSISTKKRVDLFGIQILKWLRLKGLKNHCVLYSFLNREKIMLLSSENLIIFSDGLTFVELPYNFQCLNILELSEKKAHSDLSAYFKAESRLPDNRHFYANWWGVRQLWITYKKLNNLGEENSASLEEKIFRNAKDMDSYQGLLAQYLYHKEFTSTKEMIEAKKNLINLQFINAYKNDPDLSKLEEEREQYISNKETFITVLNKINSKGTLIKFIKKEKINSLTKSINEISDNVSSIDTKIALIKDRLENYINKIQTILATEQTNPNNNVNIQHKVKELGISENFLNQLWENPPKILYIDDQANEGWSDIIQLMIYNKIDSSNFSVYSPVKGMDENDLINNCFEKAKKTIDLIILDLRLQGEEGPTNDISNISGIKVLKALKNGNAANEPIVCPILVVTASNKSRMLQYINYLGADAYWMKEGLDNNFTAEESIDNYWDLITKVFMLTHSPIYLIIKKMREQRNIFKPNQIFWWNSGERFKLKNVFFDPIKTSKFNAILNNTINLLESTLRDDLTKSYSSEFSNSILSLIAIRLFEIIEDIHKERYKPIPVVALFEDHHGKNNSSLQSLKSLQKCRNKSVHQNSINIKDFLAYFETLVNYLSKEQSSSVQEIKIVGKIDVSASPKIGQNKKRQ